MKYYKRNNGEIYEKRETEIPIDGNCEEITEDEYNSAINKINSKIQIELEEQNDSSNSEDSYIQQLEAKNAELEAENAALLYQILTGEELENGTL